MHTVHGVRALGKHEPYALATRQLLLCTAGEWVVVVVQETMRMRPAVPRG